MSDEEDSDVATVRINFNVPIALNDEMTKKLATSKYATKAELVRSLIRAWLEELPVVPMNMSGSSESTKDK